MASSSDSEEDIAISCRRRATRARRSVLEDGPTELAEQLFHDREVYAAEGESGDDSECSLNQLKSSFGAVEGKCDQKRRTSKVSKKKEMRKMRSETQRILRGKYLSQTTRLCMCMCVLCKCTPPFSDLSEHAGVPAQEEESRRFLGQAPEPQASPIQGAATPPKATGAATTSEAVLRSRSVSRQVCTSLPCAGPKGAGS